MASTGLKARKARRVSLVDKVPQGHVDCRALKVHKARKGQQGNRDCLDEPVLNRQRRMS